MLGALSPALRVGNPATQRPLASIIKGMFTNVEQGVWYDPSDLSTMFQDTAGTIPVTAVEQPVGRILDKSGRGNHASQTTATSRPVLSARVNLLTKTEQLSNAAWSKSTIGTGVVPVVTDNFGIAPNGTQTASRVQLSVGSGTAVSDISYLTQAVSNSLPSTGRVYMRLNTGASKLISLRVGAKIEQKTVTSEWQEFSVSDSTGNRMDILLYGNTGDGTADLLVWHPDLRPANTGRSLPDYQRVNTATDYDIAGFPYYLKFDGTDDFLVTPSINFTGTDKMMVCAGVRKLGTSAGIVVELGNASGGAFWFGAPGNANNDDIFSVTGSILQSVRKQNSAPFTGVYSLLSEIGQKILVGRQNGAAMTVISGVDLGTGNFSNYPLYIGRRGGTSLPFNGHLYGLIVRGATTSDSQIKSVEKYINGKTGAF